ncbi:PepSY domain-containing protein [Nitrospira lenta]|uniref:PepSY domain-containing protein n=1 Tax=Nitrospira lenta TaxID=1436998 RepID=A0A330LAG7_9BACT|nr:PepSY domain-containing protein [Nitrospira lenta]SPP65884.1 conserved exported hypothetical protein [Nitrospira lenta]
MKSLALIFTLAVGSVLTLGTPAWSDKKKGAEGEVATWAKDATVTIEQAVKTAVEKVPGTVVEAELENKHGQITWEVDVLGADGKMTEVCIDAVTGAVIGTEAKDKKDEMKKEGKKGK